MCSLISNIVVQPRIYCNCLGSWHLIVRHLIAKHFIVIVWQLIVKAFVVDRRWSTNYKIERHSRLSTPFHILLHMYSSDPSEMHFLLHFYLSYYQIVCSKVSAVCFYAHDVSFLLLVTVGAAVKSVNLQQNCPEDVSCEEKWWIN